MILRRSNADIVLNDIETSREHAEVEVYDATVLLHDLGSTNVTPDNVQRTTCNALRVMS